MRPLFLIDEPISIEIKLPACRVSDHVFVIYVYIAPWTSLCQHVLQPCRRLPAFPARVGMIVTLANHITATIVVIPASRVSGLVIRRKVAVHTACWTQKTSLVNGNLDGVQVVSLDSHPRGQPSHGYKNHDKPQRPTCAFTKQK